MIEEIKALRVQPGEVLVIQCDRHLTAQQREHFKEMFSHLGVKVAILEKGVEVAGVQKTC